MDLVIEDYGVFLGKESRRLTVKQHGKVISEYPLFDIDHVIIGSKGVTLSSDLIQECADQGIAIDYLGFDDRPYASLHSPNLVGTVRTRREQLLAYYDQRSVEVTKAITVGNLHNQANNLKYFAKYRKKVDPSLAEEVESSVKVIRSYTERIMKLDGRSVEDIRQDVLTLEAHAGKGYWDVVRALLKVEFPGRQHRESTDPVNCLLNYGYAILLSKVWASLVLAGLDPYGGFLHIDRPGRPSMALDFMEEFRAPVVDRSVFGFVNRGMEIEMEGDKLTPSTRKRFADYLLKRLDSQEQYEGRKVRLRAIIARQAQHLATFFRGERKYKAFVMSW